MRHLIIPVVMYFCGAAAMWSCGASGPQVDKGFFRVDARPDGAVCVDMYEVTPDAPGGKKVAQDCVLKPADAGSVVKLKQRHFRAVCIADPAMCKAALDTACADGVTEACRE